MLQKSFIVMLLLVLTFPVAGQDTLALHLDDFRDPSKSWSEVGSVKMGYSGEEVKTTKGENIILNQPTKKRPGEDIYSNKEFGDFDLSFEYMMAPHSNSGVYMHGRYEVQLLDSWGKTHVKYSDNGGLYERWTDQDTGYEGAAPRQNVSRAPGLWQQMDISFTAPRFDESGTKTEDARITVYLNGILIHDNISLSGPTRGSNGEEATRGPLRIQGDHGTVALRNIQIVPFDNELPALADLNYDVYEGPFKETPDFNKIQPVASGKLTQLSADVSPVNNNFLIRYKGSMNIPTAGSYSFDRTFSGGGGALMIDGKEVIKRSDGNGEGTVQLEEGQHSFELHYTKEVEWRSAGMLLTVNGPGIRPLPLVDATGNMGDTVDPIYLDAPAVHRSFMDLPSGTRVVRAVNVGSDQQVHYTYDLGTGAIVQVWRGEFLNTTPMWHERGDGSSLPRGSVSYLDADAPVIEPLANEQAAWGADTTGLDFTIKGYDISEDGSPIFHYMIGATKVSDHSEVIPEGHGLKRTITTEGGNGTYYARVARGKEITEVSGGLYQVGDQHYYVELGDTVKPVVRKASDGMQEILVPVNSSLTYSILF